MSKAVPKKNAGRSAPEKQTPPADSTTKESRCFLFRRSPEQLPCGKKRLYRLWNAGSLFLSAAVLCVMTLLLAYGPYAHALFSGYFSNPLIFLLNLLPILLLQLLLYACTGRKWLAYLITASLFTIAAVSNYYKLTLRDDPVVFSDLSAMFTAAGFAGHYTLTLNWRVVLAVCAIPLGALFHLFLTRSRPTRRVRLILALAVTLSLCPLWSLVYAQDSVFHSPALVNAQTAGHLSETQQMVSKGFVYSFVNSATKVFEQKPKGYREEAVKKDLAAFREEDIPTAQKVNLLALQLEAFADLEELGISGIDPTAYAAYHAVKAESYAGRLITNIFAGGTIDTERCFLTGSSVLHSYAKNTPSYAWYLQSQGYQTTGSHPSTQIYYNRKQVNAHLGFETYDYTENRFEQLSGGLTANDDILFPELIRKFEAAVQEGPVFDFTVTYQGHGPYNTEQLEADTVLWHKEGCSEAAYNAVNNYLASVKNTGENLLALTQAFSRSDEPIVVLIYGDHKPWMGNAASIYEELGISFDLSTEQGVTDYYGTEYLIWANAAAKEQVGFAFEGEAPTTSSGYLMNIVFNTLGWKGPAYMQLTEQLRQTLPVVTSTGVVFNQDGLTYTLTQEEKAALSRLLCAQYYRHRHFGDVD